MDKPQVSAEELAAEQAAQLEAKEEEVRAEIIAEFELDETDDAPKIAKLVEREMKHRKALSTAIGQKISHRTNADKLAEELAKAAVKPPKADEEADLDAKLDAKLNERLEKRDLEAMNYPDDLKKEIQRVAQIGNISLKKAQEDPYIAAKIEAYEKAQAAEGASTRNNHSPGGSSTDFDINKPPKVDMNTEAGRKAHKAWVDEGKKRGF